MEAKQSSLPLDAADAPTPSGRRSPSGVATTELALSAHVGTNADVFPSILGLHVPLGAKIADVTYGKGVFWKKVRADDYELHASDIATGIDCRNLPYDSESFDVVVSIRRTWKVSFGAVPQPKPVRVPTIPFEATTPMETKLREPEGPSGMQRFWNCMWKVLGKPIEC